jgi:hypothetical protein
MMQQQFEQEMWQWEMEMQAQQRSYAQKRQQQKQGRSMNSVMGASNGMQQHSASAQQEQGSGSQSAGANSERSSAGNNNKSSGKSSSSQSSSSSLASNGGSKSGRSSDANHSKTTSGNETHDATTKDSHRDKKEEKDSKTHRQHETFDKTHRMGAAERRVQGSDIGIVKLLEVAHRELHRADNDYRGHRAAAMGHVESAIRQLGGSAPMTSTVGTGNLAQSTSDLHLREAHSRLETAEIALRNHKRQETHHHVAIVSVSEAMQQLRRALEVRAAQSAQ